MLDTHAAFKRLTSAGVAEPQAEAIVDFLRTAIHETRLDTFITTADVATFKRRFTIKLYEDAIRTGDATGGAVRNVPMVGGYRGSSGRGLSPPRTESSGATAASLAAHAAGGLVRRVHPPREP